MPFQKGQSGNPAGSPPKHRALTAILQAAGNATVEVAADGKRHARKHILATLMWQAATEGTATLPNGTPVTFTPADIVAAAKWLYSHIDGPPKAEYDVTSDGAALAFIFTERAPGAGGVDASADGVPAE